MAIPTRFTSYLLAFHGMKTWKQILKYAGFNVVSSGHSVGSWGTFIKSPRRCTFTRGNSFFKDGIFAPELQD